MKKRISESARSAAEDQIRTRQLEVSYDTRDFPLKHLAEQYAKGNLYRPDYQREGVWARRDQSQLIESLILGLPIPFMFLADMEDGRLEVIDGMQRILAITAFLNGDLKLSSLDKIPAISGFKFEDLPTSEQRRLEARTLRVIVLARNTTPEFRHEVFSRVNRLGKPLRPSEARRGGVPTPLLLLVRKLADDKTFLRLCPMSPHSRRRRENEELVLRFLAYSDRYRDFSHDVDRFLTEHLRRDTSPDELRRLTSEFERTLHFVDRHFGTFAKRVGSSSTPRVRFEALAVGTNLALRKRPDLIGHPGPIDTTWLNSDEFSRHVRTHASNSGPRLRDRIEYVRDRVLAGAR